MPHMATNDDEYDGYYIPKGTVVLGNAWSVTNRRFTTFCSLTFSCFTDRSILHDPELFNNPMEYEPERYLKDGLLKPDYLGNINSVVFGFGRRLVFFSPNIDTYLMDYLLEFAQEDIWLTICYTRLYPVFSQSMTSNHQLTIWEILSSLKQMSPAIFYRKKHSRCKKKRNLKKKFSAFFSQLPCSFQVYHQASNTCSRGFNPG